MYQLRNYQQDAVNATISHFRKHDSPALLALPTGAGKSLIIAELASIARGRVLVLTHVKELVEQNHQKYESYGLKAAIFSAGLGRKETQEKVVFASVQSMVNSLERFEESFSLLVIDECHRVPLNGDSSYQRCIEHLQSLNPKLKILGLTATPYRLGLGWIYQYHTQGFIRSEEPRFFKYCILDVPMSYLMQEGYLTQPKLMDIPSLSYDFSGLTSSKNGFFKEAELNKVIDKSKRITPQIIAQVIETAKQRKGVMIFASTVDHAREIAMLLPPEQTALILGETPQDERDNIITEFKNQQLKYLVNVSVLTTGFDAPHVDLIAILRPTESISLYQQIVGRGLRLAENKTDCLVMDYAGNGYDVFQPEVGERKPNSDSSIVHVPCPACGFTNEFWGIENDDGFVLEHYGRQCQGFKKNPNEPSKPEPCGYRFKVKFCDECGADNDIAARRCHQCDEIMVDPDKKLRDAMKLKDARISYIKDIQLTPGKNKNNKPQLKVTYLGEDDVQIHEVWPLWNKGQKQDFLTYFIAPHLMDRHRGFTDTAPSKVAAQQHRLRHPKVIISRRQGKFWNIADKLFELGSADAD